MSNNKKQPFKDIPSSRWIHGIPKSLWHAHLYNFEHRYTGDKFVNDLTKTVHLYLEDKNAPQFLVLCGHAGAGKSHLAVGLFRALGQKYGFGGLTGAKYATYQDLMADIYQGFKENTSASSWIDCWLDSRWLVLDDITASGKVFKADSFEGSCFRDIVIRRYDDGRKLIMTTNLDKGSFNQQLGSVFGDYVLSRLSDCKYIEFPDVDFRRQEISKAR